MSVVERITRQILPLLIVAVGIALLVEFYFVNTSEYYNAAEALLICGMAAPAIQQIGVALAKEEKRRVMLVACDGVATVLSLLIAVLGEYAVYLLNYYPGVSYYLELGYVIDTTVALIASVIVIVIAFLPTPVNEKITVDAA